MQQQVRLCWWRNAKENEEYRDCQEYRNKTRNPSVMLKATQIDGDGDGDGEDDDRVMSHIPEFRLD